ncbi:hypothetical protein N806_23650 [Rhodococcus sp. P27]|nr:hypothetical protein N806_23650 [Rhodococcus sp. P27]
MADRAPEIGPDVLYYEPGSRWWAIAFGPIFCLIALVIELFTGRWCIGSVWRCSP